MKVPTILKQKNMTYILYNEKVVVGVGDKQWISYNQYDNWNRQGITQFRNALLKSKEDEYDTPTKQLSLASSCGIRGTSTAKPKEIE